MAYNNRDPRRPAQDPHQRSEGRGRDAYKRNDNWAQQVPDRGDPNAYSDYGWETGESVLPEFRDPSVRIQPGERQRVSRWQPISWSSEYNEGGVENNGPYAGVGPKGYHRSDDRIFEDVCERITRHGRIDAHQMQVHVENGEVTLTGLVDDRQTKRLIERVADQVRGVKDVHNQLRIAFRDPSMPGSTQRSARGDASDTAPLNREGDESQHESKSNPQ